MGTTQCWPLHDLLTGAESEAKAGFDGEEGVRRFIRGELAAWSKLALSSQSLVPAPHHLRMISELEAVAEGDNDRLMLLLPPGSAKSTYASLLLPPWFLARNPTASVIATSHTGGLARSFGMGVRCLISEHALRLGVELHPSSRAAERFGLVQGGNYFATGVRGPVTGRRADLVIIDDPVKSYREADSVVQRDHLWDWFRSDLVTRLKPGGRIVLVMTRWHPDDLGGRILESSDPWRVLRLPALAEPEDPLGRAPGDALWPSWEDRAALERKRALMGERSFASLFQQSPTVPGGRLFQVQRIAVLEEAMVGASVRAWDLAASAEHGDWTAGVLLCRGQGEGGYQVLDVVRFQGGPEQVEATIKRTAALDGREVTIGLPQDPGQAGRSQVSYLTRGLSGFRVSSSVEGGAKAMRATPVASQANAGNLSLLRGRWNRAFLEELQDFPNGTKDDQVDALSRAFMLLDEVSAPARSMRVHFSER
jgi:predicted phage terminase large subunit-like protein